jgi:hypothetical protein
MYAVPVNNKEALYYHIEDGWVLRRIFGRKKNEVAGRWKKTVLWGVSHFVLFGVYY